MSSNDVLWVVLGIVIVAAIAAAAVALWRNVQVKRQRQLRERFGPEYERLAAQHNGDHRRVEQELEARARRVRKLPIKALSDAERTSFTAAWQQTQERFVDTPAVAVRSAHDLVQQVMRARGYPVDDFEQRVADLSVEHAPVVEHYRAAHALHEANRGSEPNTEELRQAMVHYRALFSELLGTAQAERAPNSRPLTTAHA